MPKRAHIVTDTKGPRTVATEISPELHDQFAEIAEREGLTKAKKLLQLIEACVASRREQQPQQG